MAERRPKNQLDPCPACNGYGEFKDGSLCKECAGTGDDPRDAARLERARQQAKEGKLRWWV